MILLTPGCATTNQRLAVLAVNCSSAIPEEYKQYVQGTKLPVGATISDLAVALDTQTARLDMANGRTADMISLIQKCDARNAEIVKELAPEKKFFGLF